MLRELLAAISRSPTTTATELRLTLGLSLASWQHLIAQLQRMGYLEDPTSAASCPSGSCHGCALACTDAPEGSAMRVSARGQAWLERSANSATS